MKINYAKLELSMSRKNWNYSQLSNASQVSRATLSYIKNGKSCRPSIGGKLAKALGVDVTEIIEMEDANKC